MVELHWEGSAFRLLLVLVFFFSPKNWDASLDKSHTWDALNLLTYEDCRTNTKKYQKKKEDKVRKNQSECHMLHVTCHQRQQPPTATATRPETQMIWKTFRDIQIERDSSVQRSFFQIINDCECYDYAQLIGFV